MEALNRNKKFQNLYTDKECYLFGNGGSIKYLDLNNFKDKHSIVINWMFLHKDFKKLNIVADFTLHPYYFSPIYRSPFSKKISFAKPGKEMLNLGRFNYDHPVFICESNYHFIKKENIYYIKYKRGSSFLDNKFLLHKEFSMSQNSLYAGIGIAQYFGFKKINLIGFDYISEKSINGHFYEKGHGWISNRSLIDLDPFFVKKITNNLEIENIAIKYPTLFFKNKNYKKPIYKENINIVKRENLKKINKLKLGYNIYKQIKIPPYYSRYIDVENKIFVNFYFKKLFNLFKIKNFKIRSILWRVLSFSYYIIGNSKKILYFNSVIKSYVSKYNVKLYWHNKHYYNPFIMNWDYLYIIYKNISKITRLGLKNKNQIALDIGASVGSNAMVMSRFFDKIYAFEPSRDCGFILLKNLKKNKIKNVKFFEIALSDYNGPGVLSSPNSISSLLKLAYGGRGIYFKKKKNTEKISVKESKLFLENNFKKKQIFDFIKLDCEGSELKIIKNLNEKLKNVKVIQQEFNFEITLYKLSTMTNFLISKNFLSIYYYSKKFTLDFPKKKTKETSIEIFSFNKRFFSLNLVKKFIESNNLELAKCK